jgi:hypothetical protein
LSSLGLQRKWHAFCARSGMESSMRWVSAS